MTKIHFVLCLVLFTFQLSANEDPFGSKFHKTFEEIHAVFEEFAGKNPEFVKKHSLIVTPQGRPLDIFTLGNENSGRRVLLLCNHHGDEQWVAQLCVDFTKYLLANKDTVSWLKEFFEKNTLDILPIGNPDGFAIGGRYNSKGNDINRNFPYMWGYKEPGSVNTHPGPHAISEPETKALYDYQMQHKQEWTAILNYHLRFEGSDSKNYILLPWAYTKKKKLSEEEMQKYQPYLPSKNEAPSFIVDTVPNVFYPCSGVHTDWTWSEFQAPSFTMELGHGYQLPSRKVYLEKHLAENLPVFLHFLKAAMHFN